MKTNVATFRQAIDAAFDMINVHWASCVGEQERIRWFVGAFNCFSNLKALECPRATEKDIDLRERVYDAFFSHCEEHHALWLKARAYVKLTASGASSNEAFKTLESTSAYQIIAQYSMH